MTNEHETVGDVLAEYDHICKVHSNAGWAWLRDSMRRIKRAHARDREMREAIRKMAHALESGEWAEHVLDSDDDVARLEAQITVLVGALHESSKALIESAHARESAAQVGVPDGYVPVKRATLSLIARVADSDGDEHGIACHIRALLSAAPAPAAETESTLLRATRRLVFAARTSGGTSGRDGELCAALDATEPLLPAPPSPEPRPAEPAAHPKTADLVRRFAEALAEKLAASERKYGYSDDWTSPDWMDECRKELLQHVAKGDPRDVAAYCMFLWHHGERTAEPEPKPAPEASPWRDAGAAIAAVKTLRALGYEFFGGEMWKPPMGTPPHYVTEPAPQPAPSDAGEVLDELEQYESPSDPVFQNPSDAPASPQAAQGNVEALIRRALDDAYAHGQRSAPFPVYDCARQVARRLASAQPATAKPAAEFKAGDRVEWDSGCGKLAATIRGYSLDIDDSGFVDCVPASSLTRLTGGSHD